MSRTTAPHRLFPQVLRADRAALLAAGALAALVACRQEAPKPLAPVATPAASATPAAAPAASARRFVVDTASSAVRWVMDAPLEKIYGDVPGGLSGAISVDLADLRRTTGTIEVDLTTLELFQEKRADESAAFGEKVKNEKQNEHARAWLEISEDTPADVRKTNLRAALELTAVTSSGATALEGLADGAHRFEAVVEGGFVLHGRRSPARVPVELTVDVAGGVPTRLAVRSRAPLVVGLEAHDVRPREAFGKLAAKTLAALGNKVASAAPVQVELVLTAAK